MQELAQYHLQRCDDTTNNSKTKQTFMDVVKTCYYAANCPQHMVDKHVSRVIFERVIWNRFFLRVLWNRIDLRVSFAVIICTNRNNVSSDRWVYKQLCARIIFVFICLHKATPLHPLELIYRPWLQESKHSFSFDRKEGLLANQS